ncbi:hypothetical protein [Hymenobacter cellulosilyticus]|uniref:Uncharacterized protein n=1 Tax=Hymenobacter cellulosilyticus TaxID=2932248 RepID=A0A8T9Q7Y1_9BACT|nr:hypothetical protein [Hymenobacter cellulosilyticus]UOQ71123.1 hypothetical protein MUN79_21005 [Hymenobacter cellulosilyticus]
MSTFADRLLDFLTTFPLPANLPDEAVALSPYQESTPGRCLPSLPGSTTTTTAPA